MQIYPKNLFNISSFSQGRGLRRGAKLNKLAWNTAQNDRLVIKLLNIRHSEDFVVGMLIQARKLFRRISLKLNPLLGTLAEPTKLSWVVWNCVPYGWGFRRGDDEKRKTLFRNCYFSPLTQRQFLSLPLERVVCNSHSKPVSKSLAGAFGQKLWNQFWVTYLLTLKFFALLRMTEFAWVKFLKET